MAPVYGPRAPRERAIEPYEAYLRDRVLAFPGLSGVRLLREVRAIGYEGGYTAVTDFLRTVRPSVPKPFERRFENESAVGAAEAIGGAPPGFDS